MTVIAAHYNGTAAAIASDGAGTAGDLSEHCGSKVLAIRPDMLAGSCGSYLLTEWLRRAFAPAVRREVDELVLRGRYDDLEAVQDVLSDAWAGWPVNVKQRMDAGCKLDIEGDAVLVVCPRRAWICHYDGSIVPFLDLLAATGSGCKVALGAMWVALELGIGEPEVVARYGVLAASQRLTGCNFGPYVLATNKDFP